MSGANNNERHPLQVMYGVGGERSLVEAELHHLSGYDHARPVRIGNGAYNQRQHDIWGSILDSFYLHAKSREQVPENLWPVLKRQVEEAIKHWREPDRGIWEVRGEPQHFTSSKVMCWVALDRGAKLAERQGEKSYAQQWRAIADEIKADILEHGVDSRGVFTQRYGDEALDASLLLVVLTRFLPPDDPRVRNTVLAIADELTEDGLVLRYRVHETDDGLSGEEGTFTICSFWLVSALVEIGEVGRAKRLCERLLSFASPLLLYAEEIEPRSGRHLGNFPQAFTHLALINAVVPRDSRRGGSRQLGDVSARQRPHVGLPMPSRRKIAQIRAEMGDFASARQASTQFADPVHHRVCDIDGAGADVGRPLIRRVGDAKEGDRDLDHAIAPYADGTGLRDGRQYGVRAASQRDRCRDN
ncbi:glycoside hydrolase [Mycobacterium tuberculosis]|nr:glycoside hydrolase [Mycobacterium tuberculosis]CNM21193.1 glycoside hydrolase [Mycobacterium tuberculosis]CNM96346.1 glycoside hydrolase [Mycobacterium tuberculosis]CNN30473.1 glycoside hydrolase [Mycobacterium tuberculosis]